VTARVSSAASRGGAGEHDPARLRSMRVAARWWRRVWDSGQSADLAAGDSPASTSGGTRLRPRVETIKNGQAMPYNTYRLGALGDRRRDGSAHDSSPTCRGLRCRAPSAATVTGVAHLKSALNLGASRYEGRDRRVSEATRISSR